MRTQKRDEGKNEGRESFMEAQWVHHTHVGQNSCPERCDQMTWHTYFTGNVWAAESETLTVRSGSLLFIHSETINTSKGE